MSEEFSDVNPSFMFGDDGFFLDPFGQPCVLMGVVEFSKFCHHLDALFESPLGRKLIYAATDAEERILSTHTSVQFGRWFGKSRAKKRLQKRAMEMGWGEFREVSISTPAHDGLAVGFSLAHHEHISQQRATVQWNQVSADLIHLDFSAKNENITPAPSPPRLPWFGSEHQGLSSSPLNLELDRRSSSFFNGDERSFFLPTHVFLHLFGSLLGRPLSEDFSSQYSLEVEESVDHASTFRAVIFAASQAFQANERPVYVQSASDWEGHFADRLTKRGFGKVRVEKSILDEDISIFSVHSPVAPVAIGLLIGMWHRAHGVFGEVKIEVDSDALLVSISPRRVDYT